jgi:hypothetical protein
MPMKKRGGESGGDAAHAPGPARKKAKHDIQEPAAVKAALEGAGPAKKEGAGADGKVKKKHWQVKEDNVLLKHAVLTNPFKPHQEKKEILLWADVSEGVNNELMIDASSPLYKTADACRSRTIRCLDSYSKESTRNKRLTGVEDDVQTSISSAVETLIEAKKDADEAASKSKADKEKKAKQTATLVAAGQLARNAAMAGVNVTVAGADDSDELPPPDNDDEEEEPDVKPQKAKKPRNSLEAAMAPLVGMGQSLADALKDDAAATVMAKLRSEELKEESRRFDIERQDRLDREVRERQDRLEREAKQAERDKGQQDFLMSMMQIMQKALAANPAPR